MSFFKNKILECLSHNSIWLFLEVSYELKLKKTKSENWDWDHSWIPGTGDLGWSSLKKLNGKSWFTEIRNGKRSFLCNFSVTEINRLLTLLSTALKLLTLSQKRFYKLSKRIYGHLERTRALKQSNWKFTQTCFDFGWGV